MNITDHLRKLKEKVRKHGRYHALAAATGLTHQWIAHFAVSDENTGFHTKHVGLVEAYFARPRRLKVSSAKAAALPSRELQPSLDRADHSAGLSDSFPGQS